MRAGCKGGCRKIDVFNQFIVGEIGVALWRVARRSMKVRERNFAFAFGTAHPDNRLQRGQRDTHITWMSGNALVALAENSVNTIVTFDCAAAAPRIPLVARWKRGIVKIIAARSLQKI